MPTGRSFLLIDDSHDLPALLERAFRRALPGSVVYPKPSGEHGIEHLLQCGERIPLPDLVLLDRIMPGGMDGFETLQAIRRVERLANLAVLMISGSDENEHILQAREAGADGYVRKPVVDHEVQGFASQVALWRPEESWRSYGGTASGLELLRAAREVGSASSILTTMNHPAVASHVPMAPAAADQSFAAKMGEFFQFVMAMARDAGDPVDAAINAACRRHAIPVRHAKGTSKDQVTVANRHAVFMTLMDGGMSDLVILENFPLSKRQIERVRADWRARRGGVLSLDKQ